jgi:translation initiation factor 1
METIYLHIEKKGRGGKVVTILKGFTRRSDYLEELTRKIKITCGTGGTVKERIVEIQGDCRNRIGELLQREGFQVKGLLNIK